MVTPVSMYIYVGMIYVYIEWVIIIVAGVVGFLKKRNKQSLRQLQIIRVLYV